MNPVIETFSAASICDVLMLLYNFILQFNTMSQKSAAEIDTTLLVNYKKNFKAVLLDELHNLTSCYFELAAIF